MRRFLSKHPHFKCSASVNIADSLLPTDYFVDCYQSCKNYSKKEIKLQLLEVECNQLADTVANFQIHLTTVTVNE